MLTADSFDNAITASMAIGGSTNAIVHVIALAGRAGIKLDLERFDALSRRTPVIANVRPSGKSYLMEDFYNAGGLKALLWRLRDLLHLDCTTVSGKTLGDNIAGSEVIDDDVILPLNKALSEEGGTFVLRNEN
jgi:dihydroxy-acid dehydratase